MKHLTKVVLLMTIALGLALTGGCVYTPARGGGWVRGHWAGYRGDVWVPGHYR